MSFNFKLVAENTFIWQITQQTVQEGYGGKHITLPLRNSMLIQPAVHIRVLLLRGLKRR